MNPLVESPLELLAQLTQDNEALREAARRKDQFLAMVAHELRSPLNAILGWVEMLESGDLPPEEHLTAFRTIRRNARIQVQLSEDLLDIARIIGGTLRLDCRPGPLGPIVQAAIDAARPIAEAKGVVLVLVPALGDTTASILVDPDRMQQVVGNLIGNAVKFTPALGKVEVSTRRVEGGVELLVADEGEGIEPSFLPHVFDRFLQAKAEGSRRGGLGLGLAIVKYITEMHEGTVRAASAGLGLGAQFSLYLPAFTAAAEHNVLSPTSLVVDAQGCSLVTGLTILVVEDDPDTLRLLTREPFGLESLRPDPFVDRRAADRPAD